MRRAAFGLERRDFGRRQRQRLAAVDRRQLSRQPHLAPQVEFLRRLVAWIKQAGSLQPLNRRVISVEAPRLVVRGVWINAQPMQVVQNRVGDIPASSARYRCRRSAG